MKYFGEPQCPYCGKRVNLIRTWSLKRQGEYCCTHCGGYSNVHHLPILYVLALVCALVAICIYVFERYIFETIELKTALRVFIPFVIFFVGSLFFIQLKKPELKTGERESLAAKLDAKKRKAKRSPLRAALFGEKKPLRKPHREPEPYRHSRHTLSKDRHNKGRHHPYRRSIPSRCRIRRRPACILRYRKERIPIPKTVDFPENAKKFLCFRGILIIQKD